MEHLIQTEAIQEIIIEELLPSPAAEKIRRIMDTISSLQKGLYSLAVSEDGAELNLLKAGTVFQIFLMDTLASGKKPQELSREDWASIGNKVLHYAVIEDGKRYSELVFSLYADYIDLSASPLKGKINEKSFEDIKALAASIRENAVLLREDNIKEADYIENSLWLSFEAMVKLLASSLKVVIPEDNANLLEAVSQLAFEYGRYVLFAREQKILEKYLEHQRTLDEKLQQEYTDYLTAVQQKAEQFRDLIEKAFSPELHEALEQTAMLARAAGVNEEELLTSVEEIDAFFME